MILKQAGIAHYHPIELPGLREAFGSFEGGFNKDMAAAGAKQLGLKDSAALFSKMKAGALPVAESQNALARDRPAGHGGKLSAGEEAVLRQRYATLVENAEAHGDNNILAISSGTAMQIMISDLTADTAKR